MTERLTGKVAFITGAARGQGRAIETYPQLAQMITPFLPTWAAEPEDIADAVCWLASEESKNVTAGPISIDQEMMQY
jgi:NAD(P)-dependent dehydrogenase (short-subunit alcohol dehydrogenase family)